ncbi:hypothetical protein F5Y17DRAFT_472911 [Xylariaceae sp. FL0594]|nr:hypothetical protein F5Y17DRAFT_472911 [Xylariaceae sp. FL0594]
MEGKQQEKNGKGQDMAGKKEEQPKNNNVGRYICRKTKLNSTEVCGAVLINDQHDIASHNCNHHKLGAYQQAKNSGRVSCPGCPDTSKNIKSLVKHVKDHGIQGPGTEADLRSYNGIPDPPRSRKRKADEAEQKTTAGRAAKRQAVGAEKDKKTPGTDEESSSESEEEDDDDSLFVRDLADYPPTTKRPGKDDDDFAGPGGAGGGGGPGLGEQCLSNHMVSACS